MGNIEKHLFKLLIIYSFIYIYIVIKYKNNNKMHILL